MPPNPRPRLDPLTVEQRSERMASIRNKNTGPELTVRRLVHRLGYRYRLHSPQLPGHPDIVFTKRRKIIFVHGCFWHQHGCGKYKMPRTRSAFWGAKLGRNRQRDREVRRRLGALGWKILVVWECQIKNLVRLEERLDTFLGTPN
ncbi:DNA mismatch endonuclease Vsr [Gemmatimonas aurantiaca]|uniref:very short patch repair endonuclease n=1 Tax=Gemmatimonas aurantiaca TaxID=173480 RepID=UPI00301D47D2